MLAITYKPMKINKNKGSQMGTSKKNKNKKIRKPNFNETKLILYGIIKAITRENLFLKNFKKKFHSEI